ncbi:MAG: class I SAM-dependent methyltransferase, partial [Methylococcaceae bacterium]
LEIGCGTGGNLSLLSKYGVLTGIELYDEAIEIASKRNICPIRKGSLPDNLQLSDKFDLICMLDVLEHIEDDSGALNSLAPQLSSNGMLLITVPAYMFLWSAHDEIHHHQRRYTRKKLEDIIVKSGLKIKYSSYFNTLLFPLVYSVRLAGKLANKTQASDVNMPTPIVNLILQSIFQLEELILRLIILPFGVSILVLAEKQS